MDTPMLEEARQALDSGNQDQARRLLRQILLSNRHDTAAWWMFAELAVNDLQKIFCLEQILLEEHENVLARQWLADLRSQNRAGGLAAAPAPLQEPSPPPQPTQRIVDEAPGLPEAAPSDPPVEASAVQPEQAYHPCPHLGLVNDHLSLAAFPSPQNVCYWGEPPREISPSYQKAFCLSENYVQCELLNAPKRKGSLLNVLRGKAEKGK